jgi:hypothetical protein
VDVQRQQRDGDREDRVAEEDDPLQLASTTNLLIVVGEWIT